MDNLISHGKVVRGWLGVSIQPITPEIAKGFGLEETSGALVADVVKDGPADKAGIKRGDVIVSLDGQAVDSANTLKNLAAQVEVKKTVPVVIIRDGKEQTLQVRMGEQPTQEQAASQTAAVLGLHVQELTSDIASQLGYTSDTGVVVVSVDQGSPAANIGLQRGDLIKEINRQPIESLEDYQQATASLKEGEGLLLLVRRGENTYYVVVNPE